MITEIGGTVGDIESLPFLEAARQVRHDVGRDNVFFLHVSLVPYLAPSGELKTKPTQHSVAALRNIGIQPDALVCRSDREIPDALKRKISLMCDVDAEAVVATPDAPSIYDIPRVLHREGLDAYVVRRLGLTFHDVDWTDLGRPARAGAPPGRDRADRAGRQVHRPAGRLPVGHRGAARRRVRATAPGWRSSGSPSDDCATPAGAAAALADVQGVLIPGGFGVRGIEGKIGAISYARINRIPMLGLCLGLQCMVIEAARNLAGLGGANSAEFDANAADPVIATMADQHDVVAGAKRHGRHHAARRLPGAAGRRARWSPRSTAAPTVSERHRHRYEVNNAYRDALEEAGLHLSGTSPDASLVEFVELDRDAAPVLRRHPGPPGVQVPADPAAPAVRRVRPGRAGLPGVRAAADRRRRAATASSVRPRSWWPARSPGERAPHRRPPDSRRRAPRCSRWCRASGSSTAWSPRCGSTRW